jgi:hypothetical protein
MNAEASNFNPALLGAEVNSFTIDSRQVKRATFFLLSHKRISRTIALTASFKIRINSSGPRLKKALQHVSRDRINSRNIERF